VAGKTAEYLKFTTYNHGLMTRKSTPLPRISKGDIIEVDVSTGYSYLQDQGLVSGMRLTRFLPGIFSKKLRAKTLEDLVHRKALYRANALTSLLLLENYARVVDNLPIPTSDANPPIMIMSGWSKDPNKWRIRDADGKQILASDFRRIYPDVDVNELPRHNDVPSPRTLKARIEAGWTPSNKVPILLEDVPMPSSSVIGEIIDKPKTLYFVHFANRKSAKQLVKELDTVDLRTEVSDHEQDGVWTVEIERNGYVDETFVNQVKEIADRLGGTYAGDLDISE